MVEAVQKNTNKFSSIEESKDVVGGRSLINIDEQDREWLL